MESDFDQGGTVTDHVRQDAERRFGARPTTAPPLRRATAPDAPAAPAAPRVVPKIDAVGELHAHCCVCLTAAISHVAVPCFHMSVCGVCHTRLRACPICRRPVSGFHRVFLAAA